MSLYIYILLFKSFEFSLRFFCPYFPVFRAMVMLYDIFRVMIIPHCPVFRAIMFYCLRPLNFHCVLSPYFPIFKVITNIYSVTSVSTLNAEIFRPGKTLNSAIFHVVCGQWNSYRELAFMAVIYLQKQPSEVFYEKRNF